MNSDSEQVCPAAIERSPLRATVVGCGTIGAAIGAALASRGLNVTLYDNDPVCREALAGNPPLFAEPDMAQAVLAARTAMRLRVVDHLERQPFPTHYIVCTPTPVTTTGEFDASAIDSAVAAIIDVAQPDDAIFIRSTVPIGTTRRLAARTESRGLDLRLAFTPDRSIGGCTFADQFSVPQLIGGVDGRAAARAVALFAPLGQVIDLGGAEAAEAAKLFANTWRATMFAAANALAMVCETQGLDVHAIFAATGANYPRFSPHRPGPVGGACLPKDVRLLAASTPPEAGALLHGVSQSETQLIALVATALDAHLATRKAPARIAIAGFAFKGQPAVDDARGSAALALAEGLRARWPDAVLVGWDATMSASHIEAAALIPQASLHAAVNGADLAVFGNNHPVLAQTDLDGLALVAAPGALFYDLYGVTVPYRPTLPNGVRHHIFGRGEPGERQR
jgi:nucleotide sugar dehydrogenase